MKDSGRERSRRRAAAREAERDAEGERRWPDAPPVRMYRVDSSALAAVGYDAERCLLHVRFRHTGLYTYRNVPPDVFAALLAAESKGRFYNQYIRNAFEQYRRLEPEGDEPEADEAASPEPG